MAKASPRSSRRRRGLGPLVHELPATGARSRVPVAVACEVLGLTTRGYYESLKDPVSPRDYDTHVIEAFLATHQDDATLDCRFLTDELADVGIIASRNRVWRLCSTAGVLASHHRRKGEADKPGPPVHDDLLAVVDEKVRVRHKFTATATAPNQLRLTDMAEHWIVGRLAYKSRDWQPPRCENAIALALACRDDLPLGQRAISIQEGHQDSEQQRPAWLDGPRRVGHRQRVIEWVFSLLQSNVLDSVTGRPRGRPS